MTSDKQAQGKTYTFLKIKMRPVANPALPLADLC